MIKLAFVFRSAPFGRSNCREGLDALLAASAFCHEDEIAVFFMDDGVFNLIKDQQGEQILQKDFTRAFKLLDLYEIEQRYCCQQSLQRFGEIDPIIKTAVLSREALLHKLQQAEKVMTF